MQRADRRISNRGTSFGLADGVAVVAGGIMSDDFNFTLVIDPPREARVGARVRHDRASHGIKSLSLVSGIRNTPVRRTRVTRRYLIPLAGSTEKRRAPRVFFRAILNQLLSPRAKVSLKLSFPHAASSL